jgi:hypothetical protein
MNDIKKHILLQVCDFLSKNGITLEYSILDQNVTLEITQKPKMETQKPKPKIKFRPKPKIKFKPKPKIKFNPKPKMETQNPKPKIKFKPKSIFKSFIQICQSNNIQFFEFFDTNKWNGPAIKLLNLDTIHLFQSIHTTIINGYGFYIVRPTIQSNNNIQYPKYTNTIEPSSLIVNYSEDEDEDVLELDEWYFHDVKYLIHTQSNTLYCYQTNERVGKKIDEFNIQLF